MSPEEIDFVLRMSDVHNKIEKNPPKVGNSTQVLLDKSILDLQETDQSYENSPNNDKKCDQNKWYNIFFIIVTDLQYI
jgi:hypothetical protein